MTENTKAANTASEVEAAKRTDEAAQEGAQEAEGAAPAPAVAAGAGKARKAAPARRKAAVGPAMGKAPAKGPFTVIGEPQDGVAGAGGTRGPGVAGEVLAGVPAVVAPLGASDAPDQSGEQQHPSDQADRATQRDSDQAAAQARPRLRIVLGDGSLADPHVAPPPAAHLEDGAVTAEQIVATVRNRLAGIASPTLDDIQDVMVEAILAGAGPLERDPILAMLADAAAALDVGKQALISTWSALVKQRDAEQRGGGDGGDAPRRTVWRADPEPAEDAVTTEAVFTEVRDMIGTYIHAPRHTVTLAALLSMATYVVPVLDAVPYGRITSPVKRCGKSTLMLLVASLCRRALSSSNISASVIYRAIDGSEATLLIDEIDRLKQSAEWPVMQGLVNAGNTRETSGVLRSAGDDHDPHVYESFGVKVFAGIGAVEDTLGDRCIELHLERRPRDVPRTKFRPRQQAEALAALRARLERWAVDTGRQRVPGLIDVARERLDARADALRCENDRLIDITEPLLAIALTAGEDSVMVTEVTGAVSALMRTDAGSEDGGDDLLNDIARAMAGWRADVAAGRALPAGVGVVQRRQVVEKDDGSFRATKPGALRITTAALTTALVGMEDARWPTFSRGKPLTPHALKSILRGFKIEERRMRVASPDAAGGIFKRKTGAPLVPKGFLGEDLDRAIALYAKVEQPGPDDMEAEGEG